MSPSLRRMWGGERNTCQVPANAVGAVDGFNKLWKRTKLSNMNLFLSTLCVFNLVSSSACLMILQLERLRWDSMWDCLKDRAGSYVLESSVWAGWAALHKLLEVKRNLEIFHLWDSVGTGGEMRMERQSQGWKKINISFEPLLIFELTTLYTVFIPLFIQKPEIRLRHNSGWTTYIEAYWSLAPPFKFHVFQLIYLTFLE